MWSGSTLLKSTVTGYKASHTLLACTCVLPRFVSLQPEAERGAGGVAERLLAWLRVVVGHLQPLDQLLLSSPHQQPCGCHLTRLSLHIHWTAVSVTLRLSHVAGKSCWLSLSLSLTHTHTHTHLPPPSLALSISCSGWQWFLEQARLTLSCLLSHAASIGPASVSSLLGCSCLRELWLLLRYSLDHSPASVSPPIPPPPPFPLSTHTHTHFLSTCHAVFLECGELHCS